MNNGSRSRMDIENSGLIPNISECLTFSPAFSLTGFETVNDTVLKEMNERARNQLQNQQPQHHVPGDVHSSLQKYAQITKAPPDNRYTAAHTRQFAHQPSITEILPKRTGTGEESPSKRRRAPTGEVLGIMSPTKGLADLSIDDQERIAKTKAARHKRELQLSPRRRQQQQQKRGIQTLTTKLGDNVPKLHTAPMPRFPSLQNTPRIEPRKLFTNTPTRQTPPNASPNGPNGPNGPNTPNALRNAPNASIVPNAATNAPMNASNSSPSVPRSSSIRSTSVRTNPRSNGSGSGSNGSGSSGTGGSTQGTQPGMSPSMVRSSSTNTIRPSRPPVRNRVVSQPTPSPTHSGPLPSRPLPSRPLPSRPLPRTIPQSSSTRSLRIPQVDENLPHYARPTQATLRRSQSSQIHKPNP